MIVAAARRRLAVITVGAAAAGAAVVLAVGNPSGGGFPQCPFHRVTGLWCPGCGTQRALHALLHLQIGRAFAFNALAMCALPFIVYSYFAWATRTFAARPLPRPVPPLWLTRALPGLVVGFGVVRNLPFAHALAP